jgi:hypothetical protein
VLVTKTAEKAWLLLTHHKESVLPGPEEALLPVEPKLTAIWQKHSAISDFLKILLLFCYFSGLFLTVDLKIKSQLLSNFSFSLLFSKSTCDIKFRYFQLK